MRPDLGHGLVEFVPQVPQGQTSVQGRDIRLGGGSADVLASHAGDSYRTEIRAGRGVGADEVAIGHTLPRGAQPATVMLDGRTLQHYRVRETSRGSEVTVSTTAGHHTLTITTA